MPEDRQAEADVRRLEAAREELGRSISLLLGQLQALNQSCETDGERLKAKCAGIAAHLEKLAGVRDTLPELTWDTLSEARSALERARRSYRDAVNEPRRVKWSLLVPVLYAVVFGALLCYGWATSCWPGWMSRVAGRAAPPDPDRLATFCTVFYCVCAGGLGGASAALRDFSYFFGKRIFDPAWAPSYWCRPVLGVIMGVVAWALLRGGLLLVSDAGAAVSVSNPVYFAIAFVAGFAVEQMVRKLYDVAETVFAVTERTRRGG